MTGLVRRSRSAVASFGFFGLRRRPGSSRCSVTVPTYFTNLASSEGVEANGNGVPHLEPMEMFVCETCGVCVVQLANDPTNRLEQHAQWHLAFDEAMMAVANRLGMLGG